MSFGKSTYLSLILVAVGAGTYSNSLEGPFFYDDTLSIVENDAVKKLWPPLWLTATMAPRKGLDGRPVVSFSLALNHAIDGLNVRGYHLVNIFVHILCSVVLFAVVRRTLLCAKLRRRFGSVAAGLAFFCALIWLVHPLQSQGVNHIVRRGELIVGLFYLLSLYCVIRFVGSDRSLWGGAAVLACLLGMGSKEVMVTAPLMAVLYDRVYLSSSWHQLFSRSWLYVALAMTWSILALLMSANPHGHSIGFHGEISGWEYALNQCWVIVTYLQHTFWPYLLIFDYGFPISPLSLGDVIPYALVVVALVFLTVVSLWYLPVLGFLGAWFFVILSPTSSFVPIVNEVGAERRMYLPSAALVVLVIVGGYLALRLVAKRFGWDEHAATIGTVLVALVAVAFVQETATRNRDYRSALAIWKTVVETIPRNSRGYDGVGSALGLQGRTAEAISYYRRALEIDPNYSDAHYNVATLLQREGSLDNAISHYRKALEVAPNYIEARNNLGNALRSKGQTEEAIACYRKALEFDPDYSEGYNNLGVALASQGRIDEAIHQYRRTVGIDPDFADAHYNLAMTLGAREHNYEAIAHHRRVVELKPDLVEAHYNLATLLHQEGDLDEAILHYRKALELKSDFARAHNNLGSALGSQGHTKEAAFHYRKALEIRPDFDEARGNLDLVIGLQKHLPASLPSTR